MINKQIGRDKMDSPVIFLVIILFGLIYYAAVKISEYNEKKEKARKDAFSSFAPKPKHHYFKNEYNNTRYSEIIEKYSEFYNDLITVNYHDKVILEARRKLLISKKWGFNNIRSLERVIKVSNNIINSINEKINNSEKITEGKVEDYTIMFPHYINDKFLRLIFGELIKGYKSNDSIIFFENTILKISNDYKSIEIFERETLTAKLEFKHVRKTHSVSKNDKVVTVKWLHQNKDGSKDLRFSKNYRVYLVLETYFYFDKFQSSKVLINNYELAQKIRSAFNKEVLAEDKRDNYVKQPSNVEINNSTNQRGRLNKVVGFVFHPNFGYGEILDKYSDTITIKFSDITPKKISINYKGLNYISEAEYYSYYNDNKSSRSKIRTKELDEKIYVQHPTFGYGKILKIYDDVRVIKFNKYGIKKISTNYKEFKYVNQNEYYKSIIINVENTYNNAETIKKEEKKYIKHSTFGYGEIQEKSNDFVEIKFINHDTTKKISTKYNRFKYVEQGEYILAESQRIKTNIDTEKVNFQKKNNKVTIGDFINHKTYGISKIVEEKQDYYILKIIDGSKKTIRKHFIGELINERQLYKEDQLLKEYKENDYVYNTFFGYGKVLISNASNISILWKNNNDIQSNIKQKSPYLTIVEGETEKSLNLDLECNDIIIISYKIESLEKYGIVKRIKGDSVEYLDLIRNKVFLTDLRLIKIMKENISNFSSSIENKISLENYIEIHTRDDYYTKTEYKKIIIEAFNKYGKEHSKDNVNIISDKLSFNSITNVNEIYLNSKFKNLEEYIRLKAYTEDLYYYDYNMDSSSYKYILDKLCKEQKLIKTDSDAYITIKKINNLGIDTFAFTELQNKVIAYLEEHNFITLNKVKVFFDKKISKIIVNDQTLINLLNSFNELKSYIIGEQTTFVIKSTQLRVEYFESTLSELMESDEIESIDVYDMVSKLNDYFGFNFDVKSFVNETKKFKKIYFSEEKEKLYYKKEYYYKEVFN